MEYQKKSIRYKDCKNMQEIETPKWLFKLEQHAVRNGKKKSCQEPGLGNRGRLKVQKDTKLVLNKH